MKKNYNKFTQWMTFIFIIASTLYAVYETYEAWNIIYFKKDMFGAPLLEISESQVFHVSDRMNIPESRVLAAFNSFITLGIVSILLIISTFVYGTVRVFASSQAEEHTPSAPSPLPQPAAAPSSAAASTPGITATEKQAGHSAAANKPAEHSPKTNVSGGTAFILIIMCIAATIGMSFKTHSSWKKYVKNNSILYNIESILADYETQIENCERIKAGELLGYEDYKIFFTDPYNMSIQERKSFCNNKIRMAQEEIKSYSGGLKRAQDDVSPLHAQFKMWGVCAGLALMLSIACIIWAVPIFAAEEKQRAREAAAAPPKDKVCPFCAETIKTEAIVCRYCGRDLPTPQA